MTILSKKKAPPKKGEEKGEPPSSHPPPPPTSSLQAEGLNGGGDGNDAPGEGHRASPPRGEGPAKRRHPYSPSRMHHRSKQSRVDWLEPSAVSGVLPGGGRSPQDAPPPGADPAAGSDANAYNSEDEYEARPYSQFSEEEWTERERRFEKKMRKKGLLIKKMGEDGACLFRAVADQVYGDQEMHSVVRNHCMDYIEANSDYFSQYVTEDLEHYVQRKREAHVHGNHIEIQAISEMYSRSVLVFSYKTEPINSFHGTSHHPNANPPLRLSYHRGVHYNSLVDPYKATIGVGLGLPGHKPGSADKSILKEGLRQSEDCQIEQAMLEDKLRASDWEATNEAMEEQAARQSYLQWLKENERRSRRSPVPGSSNTAGSSGGGGGGSPGPAPGKASPEPTFQLLETASFMNQVPPELFGLEEAEEDAGILAKVLAASQAEYLESLKKSTDQNNPTS